MVDLKNIEFYKNPDDNWKEEKINSRITNIPNDINVLKLENFNTFYRGKVFSKSDIVENGINECIHYGELFTKYNIKTYKIISKTNVKKNVSQLSKIGDILMPSSDTTPKGLATAVAIMKDEVIIGGDTIGIRPDITKINSIYFSYILNNSYNLIIPLVTGSVIKHLYSKNLEKLEYMIPSIEEQEKIATILETQENLIDSKKELLEKYKKQRKYFQQELLSGRIRMKLNNKSMSEAFELGLIKQTFLNDANEVVEYGGDTITNVVIDIIDKDGFENWLSIDFENKIEFYKNIDFKEEKINGRIISIPEDFINFKLNDIFTFEKGKNAGIFTNDYINKNKGLFPVYSGKTGNNGIFGNINTFLYDLKNVLFITTVGEKAMSINLLNGKFSLSQNCALLLNKTNNNDLFLYYIVDKIMFEERIKLSSGVKPSFRKSDMNDINIFLPNVIEQTLIGEQLRKIDNLIESLEEEIKLEDKKFTYLKQELLSGRIRVN